MKAYITHELHTRQVLIHLVTEGQQSDQYHTIDKDGIVTTKEVLHSDCEGIKPLIILPQRVFQVIASQILRDKERLDIKEPSEHFMKGALDATIKHLEDMKTIAFTLINAKHDENS